jgi:hypothetical protein
VQIIGIHPQKRSDIAVRIVAERSDRNRTFLVASITGAILGKVRGKSFCAGSDASRDRGIIDIQVPPRHGPVHKGGVWMSLANHRSGLVNTPGPHWVLAVSAVSPSFLSCY